MIRFNVICLLLLTVSLSVINTNAISAFKVSNIHDVASLPNYITPGEFELARLTKFDDDDSLPPQEYETWTVEDIAKSEAQLNYFHNSINQFKNKSNQRRRRRSISDSSHSNEIDFNFDKISDAEIVKTPGQIDYENKIEIWKEKRWPNGRVPYTLHSSLSVEARLAVAQAIQEYHDKTCIRFEPRNLSDTNYVEIMKNDSIDCGQADICVEGGRQTANFGRDITCLTRATMLHELGHTLCLNHEHARSDRSKYLSLPETGLCVVQSVTPGYHDWLTDDLFYDYLSHLHYSAMCNPLCSSPKLPGVIKCRSDSLSVLDVEKLNALYECPGCRSYRFKPISKLFKTMSNDLSINDYLLWHSTFFGPAVSDDKSNKVAELGSDFEGESVYACRAYHQGDIIPGHGKLSTRSCQVVYHGQVHEKTEDFEILTVPENIGFKFVEMISDSRIPSNAIPGGRTATGTTLYIARCYLNDDKGRKSAFLGTIANTNSTTSAVLEVPKDGIQTSCSPYSILVCEENDA